MLKLFWDVQKWMDLH